MFICIPISHYLVATLSGVPTSKKYKTTLFNNIKSQVNQTYKPRIYSEYQNHQSTIYFAIKYFFKDFLKLILFVKKMCNIRCQIIPYFHSFLHYSSLLWRKQEVKKHPFDACLVLKLWVLVIYRIWQYRTSGTLMKYLL